MKISDLQKQMGNFCLSIDSLTFETGKINGIIGSNGSGKSTLAKIIMGTLPQDKGKIDYLGLTPRDITLTGQKPYLIHDSVYQNIIYPLKLRKVKIDEDYVNFWLKKTGLQDKKKQYAPSLSSGEQQKLSFARALVFKPKLVIVDETLANLDPDSGELFENIIQEIQNKEPITWITISHQLVHIKKMCDVVYFMEKGKVETFGTVDQMLLNPTNEKVKKYLATTQVAFADK